jgi:serine/threonine-protein kinase
MAEDHEATSQSGVGYADSVPTGDEPGADARRARLRELVQRSRESATTPDGFDGFVVESELGRGGMGVVLDARQPALERSVALKVLQAKGPKARSLFDHEARVTGQLDHPNIPPVNMVGSAVDGRSYFTMKKVEGQTLEQLLRAEQPGPLVHERLMHHLRIIERVCDALAFAHNRGFIHCDLKPQNVMVGSFGQVYLMDWGIARAPARPGDPEVPPLVLGTPSYMSPEQARGRIHELDERADVFSLGAVIYRIVSGRPPYRAPSTPELLQHARGAKYLALDELLEGAFVPAELIRIVHKAMAPAAADRYSSVTALQEDLVAFMRGGASFPLQEYESGALVVGEGDPGDAAYVILEGQLEVFKEIDGRHEHLRMLGPGDVFGETAILTQASRTASVRATKHTVVLRIDAENFERELDAMKPWMGAFVRVLATRFRDIDAKLSARNAEESS